VTVLPLSTAIGLRAQFDADGFVFPLRVLPDGEVARYRAAAEERLNGASTTHRLHLETDWGRELASHPAIVDAVEDLADGPVRIWGTLVLRKEPRSDAYVSWHQDSAYRTIGADDLFSAWIALTDSSATNGCMRAIPGSHRVRLPHVNVADGENLLSHGQRVVGDVDSARAVDMVLRAGEMSIHHIDVVHGSAPNRSDTPRLGFVVRYVRAGFGWEEWPLVDPHQT
jgi:ectoine hydroxylase-related dioxygenase (phytanoyl-CoA dioxygenase family)